MRSRRVMRIGNRYSVVSRAVTAETGETIVSLQRSAASKDEL